MSRYLTDLLLTYLMAGLAAWNIAIGSYWPLPVLIVAAAINLIDIAVLGAAQAARVREDDRLLRARLEFRREATR